MIIQLMFFLPRIKLKMTVVLKAYPLRHFSLDMQLIVTHSLTRQFLDCVLYVPRFKLPYLLQMNMLLGAY